MDLDKLNALYETRYGSSIPDLTADVARWTFNVEDFDKHLSLYRFRLSIWRDAYVRKNASDTIMAELDEYEKTLDELENSTFRNLTYHIVSSATGSTHIYTDREETTVITSCYFTKLED